MFKHFRRAALAIFAVASLTNPAQAEWITRTGKPEAPKRKSAPVHKLTPLHKAVQTPVVPMIAKAVPMPVAVAIAPQINRFEPKNAIPKGYPGSWVGFYDYPSQALLEEREGTTRFRLTIGPDGRVSGCEVTGSSGSPDLDSTTCAKVWVRARFAPATDSEGNPTIGTYSNAVRWVVPN